VIILHLYYNKYFFAKELSRNRVSFGEIFVGDKLFKYTWSILLQVMEMGELKLKIPEEFEDKIK
jgi:hypothetical protein